MTTAACFVDENGQFIADRKNPTVRAAGGRSGPAAASPAARTPRCAARTIPPLSLLLPHQSHKASPRLSSLPQVHVGIWDRYNDVEGDFQTRRASKTWVHADFNATTFQARAAVGV